MQSGACEQAYCTSNVCNTFNPLLTEPSPLLGGRMEPFLTFLDESPTFSAHGWLSACFHLRTSQLFAKGSQFKNCCGQLKNMLLGPENTVWRAKNCSFLLVVAMSLVDLTEMLVDADRVWKKKKTFPNRKHFIPEVPSACQISTYCTSRDVCHTNTAKHYKTNLFQQWNQVDFLPFIHTTAGPFKKDWCFPVLCINLRKVMHAHTKVWPRSTPQTAAVSSH